MIHFGCTLTIKSWKSVQKERYVWRSAQLSAWVLPLAFILTDPSRSIYLRYDSRPGIPAGNRYSWIPGQDSRPGISELNWSFCAFYLFWYWLGGFVKCVFNPPQLTRALRKRRIFRKIFVDTHCKISCNRVSCYHSISLRKYRCKIKCFVQQKCFCFCEKSLGVLWILSGHITCCDTNPSGSPRQR